MQPHLFRAVALTIKFMPAAGGEIKYGRAMGTPAYKILVHTIINLAMLSCMFSLSMNVMEWNR